MRSKILFVALFAMFFAAVFLNTKPLIFKTEAAARLAPTVEDAADGKFALLVGIDKYENVTRLHGAVTDVETMAALLETDKFGFAAKNVTVLKDEQGTAENIINAFHRQLIEKAADYKLRTGKQATVFFQYAGHGSQAPANANKADEPDGYDETIVPVNSRDAERKYFDIIDDDIAALVKELSKSTANAVYVFDSCHSGTVNRGDGLARETAADTRRQPETQIPSAWKYGGAATSATTRDADAGDKGDIFVGSDKYIMISGSRSDERSYEKITDDGVSHGALSFYLVQALKNVGAETTYRELMNRVEAEVSHDNAAQHPQISGNVNAAVLGGQIKDADIPINVVSSDAATVTIDAGKMSGIKEGSLVAFYDKNQARLAGDTGKIGEGEVTVADLKTSVVAFSPVAGRTVSKADRENARAVLLSPLFGADTLTVILETGGANSQTKTPNGDITQSLAKKLTADTAAGKPTLFKVVAKPAGAPKDSSSSSAGAVSVRRGAFREVFCGGLPASATKADCQALLPEPLLAADNKTALPMPAADEPVFYFASSESGEPIFDFYARESDPKAQDKIADALVKYARRKNLDALENRGSPLESQLKIELLAVTGEIGAAGFVTKSSDVLDLKNTDSKYRFKPGTYFQLRITNNSPDDLYITALNLGSDGAINAVYPRVSQEAVKSGVTIKTKIIRASRPYGEERFKIIATRQFSDYSLFEQGKVNRDGDLRGAKNPLSRLIEQATQGATKRTVVAEAPQTSEWAVVSPFVVVVER